MSTQPPVAPTVRDIALIGAGPIGIELAVAFRRAGLDDVHIEAGRRLDGVARREET